MTTDDDAVAIGYLAAAESLVLQARAILELDDDSYLDELFRAIVADLSETREVLGTPPWSRAQIDKP